ncbi:MAG: asparagine synthase (glutamine-hydrolyzing) [Candidatus Moranbacteria bacterium]|nr:asparagine synthase (glutamine-hydrolyzing) [Candidatus Moranbacteria bacterium]
MCGITGKIFFDTDEVSQTEIEKMNGAIIHRGPDDGGVYVSPDKKTGLGHRRLSIIDLSPLGHQPMGYLDRYWIVFNGEIYNFQEKRDLLEKEGYRFKSKSDTEVIMALYDKFGKKCLDHLRGMFAFAIYDEQEKTVFCARDRVGKKPFKYYLDGQVFMFASELKAILTQKEYRKEVDYDAIHHYLTLQYCPAPLTGFKGIKKLEAAHYLFIDLKTKKVEKERYWKLDYSKKLDLPEEEWKKRIMEKLEESVRLRMIADVPLGAFLSGGIDSSAIVALMSKLSDKPVKTFSIGFKEEKYNELKYAKIVADKFKTDHTEFIVEPHAIELLPMLVRHYEEPYADSSALPTYYVSKMTRDFVTVALNGDGGDENFGGYSRYSAFKFSLFYENFSALNNIIVLPLSKFLTDTFNSTLLERIHRFSNSINHSYTKRSGLFTNYFTIEQKNNLYSDSFKDKLAKSDSCDIAGDKFAESGAADKMDQLLYADINTSLPDDLLVKVDMASMLVSLEGRSPFLDHEFMEFCAKIPFGLKIKGLNGKKHILKKALEDILPAEIMYRKKMGFSIPLEKWFRTELKDFTYHKLLSENSSIGKIFDKNYVKNLLDDHCLEKFDHSHRIWALLALELWLEEYFA